MIPISSAVIKVYPLELGGSEPAYIAKSAIEMVSFGVSGEVKVVWLHLACGRVLTVKHSHEEKELPESVAPIFGERLPESNENGEPAS